MGPQDGAHGLHQGQASSAKPSDWGAELKRGQARLAQEDVNQTPQDSRPYDQWLKGDQLGLWGEAAWNTGLAMWGEPGREGGTCLLSGSVESQTVRVAYAFAYNSQKDL